MNNCFIYLYTFPNGKYYVGQTFHGSHRYGKVSEYKTSPAVYRAMKKYPNFKKEILVDNLTELEVDDFEIYYIKQYKSLTTENGYNISTGGYTIKKGQHISPKTEFRKNNKLQKLANKASTTKEANAKRSKSMTGKNNPMYGKTPWNSGIHTGIKPGNIRPVIITNIETGEDLEFETARKAAEYMGYTSDKNISKIIRNHSIAKNKYYVKYKGSDAK